MKKLILGLYLSLFSLGCASMDYTHTVSEVELDRFMKKWYVIAGRLTFMEKGCHNAVEDYTWNEKKQRIDIDFYFNKDSFDGKIKKIPQKAWIKNKTTNAHWKVSPFWPLKFDYLVVALADDYSWTVIGVPNQKYLWIMADHWEMDDEKLSEIIEEIKLKGYNVNEVNRVPQKW
jgi:apolipoprotein D and lipocalin family protein